MLAVLMAGLLAGCGGSDDTGGAPVSPAPAAAAAPSDPAGQPQVQRTILLDPGHNGGNASHASEINKKVPDGRGGTKPCNTVGTATDNGFPEHTFNLYVAEDVRDMLKASGVNVIMTRDDNDNGVGPCVDERGEMAQKVNADAMISIHADGAPAQDHGFHIAYSKPALNAAQGDPSISLATAVRNGLTDQMLSPANYAGKNGLIGRGDLAGLNLSKRPSILVECGNMKNAQDSINMTSDAGQARIAQGIGLGILKWLSQNPPSSLALAEATPLHSSSNASTSSSTTGTSKASTAKKHATSSTRPTHATTGSTGSTGSTTRSTTHRPAARSTATPSTTTATPDG
jgi:N-acetylmuramoyl-L-alanine amidase